MNTTAQNTRPDNFDLWQTIRNEAEQAAASEPMLASFLHLTVLRHDSLDAVLAFHLSSKLSSPIMDARALFEVYLQALNSDTAIISAVEKDLLAIYDRDPACDEYSLPLLYFKGFHAIQAHRINHWLWENGRKTLAYFLQNRSSEVFGVDIHPAARFGHGLMLDHATGFVAGETAVLGNDISILHGVTLGGSGKESGDRHPKVSDGVMIGANASILGNIRINECAKIGAGSVVVHDVPAFTTVVGVPARMVGSKNKAKPSEEMVQDFVGELEADFYI
ncbi:serine O-acetyltransferase [Neisseria weaveri]|uniref:Serine acetyltransferase n=1 Tax=Neisseria weaveri TaxID=28091 RepID=A0A3S4YSK7_9NEIS|nr:serine O-acetyltransferase [Neisseria weaveri]EGV36543.1 serine O-acetyltransferase [Neisseria weaveri ATCC 51223]EGV37936.1 serine O-acetyltransferase [Neisseria weaveri LMG 5135]SAY50310.1 protein CysE [Neisseria weaveri]VEJ51717.1 protein CysE [Neisseria weaveri]